MGLPTRRGDSRWSAALSALVPTSTKDAFMDSMYVLKPAEDAAEEAARAIQIALDRRDNGGAAAK